MFPGLKKMILIIHNSPKINYQGSDKHMLRNEFRLAVFYLKQWFSSRLTELRPVRGISEMRINSLGLVG